jgi:hypothetical protein
MTPDIDLVNGWFRRKRVPPLRVVIKRLPTEALTLLHRAISQRLPEIGPWFESDLVVLHATAWECNERTLKCLRKNKF